jgi:hypothetical protein
MEIYGKQNYKKLYFEDSDMVGLNNMKASPSIDDDKLRADLLISQLHKQLKRCYRVDTILVDRQAQYVFGIVEPFEFKSRAEYGIEVEEIQHEMIDGLKLETDFCWLDCAKLIGPGYFYSYETTSCRKCRRDCVECDDENSCNKCIPGYNVIQTPKHRELQPEEIDPLCVSGCQHGFYMKLFEGNCLECHEYCDVCRDASGSQFSFTPGEADFCWKCFENTGGEQLVLHTRTRTCIKASECKFELEEHFVQVAGFSFNQTFCMECELGCEKCEFLDSRVCLVCQTDYYLLDDKCLEETVNIMAKLGLIAGACILLIIGIVLIICVMIKKKEQKKRVCSIVKISEKWWNSRYQPR